MMGDRTFWVIERHVNNSPVYWSAGTRGKRSHDDYTPSVGSATKFYERSSAITVLRRSCGGDGRVIEHGFMEPAAILARLKRWRDVGDGPVAYCSGGQAFTDDVIALIAAYEALSLTRPERGPTPSAPDASAPAQGPLE